MIKHALFLLAAFLTILGVFSSFIPSDRAYAQNYQNPPHTTCGDKTPAEISPPVYSPTGKGWQDYCVYYYYYYWYYTNACYPSFPKSVYPDLPQSQGGCLMDTPTQTPMPMPTPTQATPRTVILPTATPVIQATPTPTAMLNDTTLSFDILLHGIGKGGDNVKPQGEGNMVPQHQNRTIEISLINNQNNKISKSGTISYDANSGSFKGTLTIGNTMASDIYLIKVKTEQFLTTIIPGMQTITSGKTNITKQFTMINGDINRENQVNILDYNILIGCYHDLSAASSCTDENNILADINDDGKVNEFDYNLFLRELSTNPGQ
jgi:hypothetical protein